MTLCDLTNKLPISQQLGKELYAFLFKEAPQVRKWFSGAENFTPEQVITTERFNAQGVKTLVAVHLLCCCCHDTNTFNHYVWQLVRLHDRHNNFNDNTNMYKAFFPIFMKFAKTKTTVTASEEDAFNKMVNAFLTHAQTVLKG